MFHDALIVVYYLIHLRMTINAELVMNIMPDPRLPKCWLNLYSDSLY